MSKYCVITGFLFITLIQNHTQASETSSQCTKNIAELNKPASSKINFTEAYVTLFKRLVYDHQGLKPYEVENLISQLEKGIILNPVSDSNLNLSVNYKIVLKVAFEKLLEASKNQISAVELASKIKIVFEEHNNKHKHIDETKKEKEALLFFKKTGFVEQKNEAWLGGFNFFYSFAKATLFYVYHSISGEIVASQIPKPKKSIDTVLKTHANINTTISNSQNAKEIYAVNKDGTHIFVYNLKGDKVFELDLFSLVDDENFKYSLVASKDKTKLIIKGFKSQNNHMGSMLNASYILVYDIEQSTGKTNIKPELEYIGSAPADIFYLPNGMALLKYLDFKAGSENYYDVTGLSGEIAKFNADFWFRPVYAITSEYKKGTLYDTEYFQSENSFFIKYYRKNETVNLAEFSMDKKMKVKNFDTTSVTQKTLLKLQVITNQNGEDIIIFYEAYEPNLYFYDVTTHTFIKTMTLKDPVVPKQTFLSYLKLKNGAEYFAVHLRNQLDKEIITELKIYNHEGQLVLNPDFNKLFPDSYITGMSEFIFHEDNHVTQFFIVRDNKKINGLSIHEVQVFGPQN